MENQRSEEIKGVNISHALRQLEKESGQKAEDMVEVKLYGRVPPINRLDAGLRRLQSCIKLSVSSNWIDRITHMQGLRNIKIMSIGRNLLKSLDGLGPVAGQLEQLWASYNSIHDLKPLRELANLKVLYIAHNLINDVSQLDNLRRLRELRDFCFYGNPVYDRMVSGDGDDIDDAAYRTEMRRRLPQVIRLDNIAYQIDLTDEEFRAKFAKEIEEAKAKMENMKQQENIRESERMEQEELMSNTEREPSSYKETSVRYSVKKEKLSVKEQY
ncbi:hypothetical protein ACOME3_008514 [Neoechinorhynchus agilis]